MNEVVERQIYLFIGISVTKRKGCKMQVAATVKIKLPIKSVRRITRMIHTVPYYCRRKKDNGLRCNVWFTQHTDAHTGGTSSMFVCVCTVVFMCFLHSTNYRSATRHHAEISHGYMDTTLQAACAPTFIQCSIMTTANRWWNNTEAAAKHHKEDVNN